MLPFWLDPEPDGLGCEHDWSIKVEIAADALPAYVRPPVFEIYCGSCGVKQSLKHRLSLVEDNVPTAEEFTPPARLVEADPEPVPLDQIVVTLNVDRYGRRYDNNRRRGIKDQAIHIDGDLRMNEALAAAAEEYVAKALGLRYNKDVSGPDRGWDLTMKSRRIQVKWTAGHSNRLISSPKQNNVADYYVLVTGPDPSVFQIRGWATLHQLKASMRDLGYGPTYFVEQADLRPFSQLLEIRLGVL